MAAIPERDFERYEPTVLPRLVTEQYGWGHWLYFDIETIPDQSDNALAKAREQVKPPATLKKQESIDLWMTENAEAKAREILSKTSFDAAAGHVCTIGWAINDGPVRVEHAEYTGEEADILRTFFAAMPKRDVTLVGHNIVGFDIPFLIRRAIMLGVELPSERAMPRDPKPWGPVFDTMHAWAGNGRGDMISMNRLCGILGIIGKEDFDGSMVAEAWAAGDHMTIARYCDDDVRRVRAIHQKFMAARF